jgi:OOP family OmpA-OmpF porin
MRPRAFGNAQTPRQRQAYNLCHDVPRKADDAAVHLARSLPVRSRRHLRHALITAIRAHPTTTTMNAPTPLRLALLAAFGTMLAPTPVLAQSSEAGYFYGGFALGEARARIDEERITAGLLGHGLAVTAFKRDERSLSGRLFGGYQLNRYLGFEAGVFDLGRYSFSATTSPAGTLDGRIKLQGLSLDLVATVPLSERFSLIGRAGAQAAWARDHFSGSGAVGVTDPDPRERAVNPKVGAGLQYELNRNLFIRGEAERYRVNDAVGNRGDVNVFSLSLVVPFGRTSAPAPRMAAAPVYVPPAPPPVMPAPPPPPPPPAPIVQAPVAPPPAPAIPERRRVSFSAESLFAFDRSTLSPDGRAALDRFAAEARDTRFDRITVEGHTDRLGTDAYNQRLSEQRAQTVKAYLVDSGGLAAATVSAVGKGESSPVTKAGDCVGQQPSPRLIACLQPDRRVEIEVTGTR